MSDAQQLRTRVSAAPICCLVCHALSSSLQAACLKVKKGFIMLQANACFVSLLVLHA